MNKTGLTIITVILSLSVSAQNISLDLRNVSVKTAMDMLSREHGYSFVFQSRDLNTQRTISVQGQNMSINEVVRQILRDQDDIEYEISDRNIIIRRKTVETVQPPPASPPPASTSPPTETGTSATVVSTTTRTAPLTITGTVTDARGETLPGVNVRIVGTNIGTATDINGRYSIVVPNADTSALSFSFIGMRTVEMPVLGRSQLHVVFEDETVHIETAVVITGYREISAEAYTGAATIISPDLFSGRAIGSIEQALMGNVSGLLATSSGQPGEQNEIRLRGNWLYECR